MTDEVALPPKTSLLGLPVSITDAGAVVRLAARAVERGGRLRIVVTNHNKCWLARSDPELRRLLLQAEVVAPETSAVWGLRVLGRASADAVWGVALMAALLDRASSEAWSVYLLGGRKPVLADLLEVVAARWPGLRVAGARDGYFGAEEEETVYAEIRACRPNLLLVGMGSPRQERFMLGLGTEAAAVMVGVGGSFDVHAGHKPDAPAWVRGSGFEWLWRAVHSPRLFRRYLVVGPWFVGAVLWERVSGRTPPRP